MRLKVTVLAFALMQIGFTSSAMAEDNVDALAKSVDAKVLAWRRDIHQFPELGNREFRTAKLVADHLKKLGLNVKTGIAHTGVVAILKGDKPGPRIAIRADMDALPVTERSTLPFASKQTSEFRGEKVGTHSLLQVTLDYLNKTP